MKLESVGILIDMRPFGDKDIIATIFSCDFGILKGMIRAGSIAKKNRPLIGQFGAVSWNARLDSQLGVFHFESEKNLTVNLMADSQKLMFVNSVFSLLSILLPEREKYESLFNNTKQLLIDLVGADIYGARKLYIDWEINLLSHLGYGFNLDACSNCGCKNDLNYLSPKTGRAVCDKCANPYLDKLFKLPISLDITKSFIGKICCGHDVKIPYARETVV
jgi:DNA repair protein RecO (recombination protein O)